MNKKTDAGQDSRNEPDAAFRQKVEERAYHLWLGSGRGHGDHLHHWLQAERELMEATKRESKAQSDSHQRKKTATTR